MKKQKIISRWIDLDTFHNFIEIEEGWRVISFSTNTIASAPSEDRYGRLLVNRAFATILLEKI